MTRIGTTNAVTNTDTTVTTNTAQTISAIKTFTNTDFLKIKNTSFGTGTFTYNRMVWTSNGNDFWADVDLTHQGDENNTKFIEMVVSNDGGTANIARAQLCVNSSQAWMMTPYRAYNASNTTDVVTIGSLQASSDVVHRTGNESISGTKTFNNDIVYAGGQNRIWGGLDGSTPFSQINVDSGGYHALLVVRLNADHTATLRLAKYQDGHDATYTDIATI